MISKLKTKSVKRKTIAQNLKLGRQNSGARMKRQKCQFKRLMKE